MPLMEKLRRLFSRREIPTEARDVLSQAKTPQELLAGLDQLITRNELQVNNINREIEALETIETQEMGKVRAGTLPERSKNNVLRRIQRLRKQMDNLEERQRIYNRNINLQIHLVGKIQALDAMELRGVDEDRIDEILSDYEDELGRYQSVLDTEDIVTSDLGPMLDDGEELTNLEAEILGEAPATTPPEPFEEEPITGDLGRDRAEPTRPEESTPERRTAAQRSATGKESESS